jgi:hypothetical protein
MQRYGQARRVSGLDQDYVAPMLPVLDPPRVLKGRIARSPETERSAAITREPRPHGPRL